MVKLVMLDFFNDRPTLAQGAYWGVRKASLSKATIVQVTAANEQIERKTIKLGKTEIFKTGHRVTLNSTYLKYPDTYADVSIAPGKPPTPEVPVPAPPPTVPGVPAPTPTTATTQIKVLIPNKDGKTFTTYPFTVSYRIPEVTEVPPPPELPPPPVKICEEGQTKTGTCPDGSVIDIQVCRNNVWVPTLKKCPPLALAKSVLILTTMGAPRLPKSYHGQEIEIVASVLNGTERSLHETALLIIDGKIIDTAKTGEDTNQPGFVSFKWVADAGTVQLHKVCVKVLKSDQYPKYSEGMDCKLIVITREVPDIKERLAMERAQLKERLELIRHERQRMRTIAIAPTPEEVPVTVPSIPEIPLAPAPIEVPEVPIEELPPPPETGWISIPAIPAPVNVVRLIDVYIDNESVGTPPIKKEVPAGKRKIRAELKGFTPIYKSVTVGPGETVTVTDLVFK